ncbi:uncharacterized protein LOC130047876 [Ostrea edulis]|uniref:uncharacterized protein LOC130047876 n=1 Tax=Ostrea edulis TaxID=37623 RepID=UPI0024AFC315|nr:uncharacterized protein LOC130047876 [Ostrea edulis]
MANHDKLKTRLFEIIDSCFFNKNGKRKYSYLVIIHPKIYFVNYRSDSTLKYSKVEIKNVLEFLIDNIFVVFGNQVFQQSVGVPMGTNCVHLLTYLFVYSYEAEIIPKRLREKRKFLAVDFNSTFRYIDDVLSINDNNFHSYVESIYPCELEIKHTPESSTSASYFNILLKVDIKGKLTTQLYDKRYDFSFSVVNFPYLCSNIPLSPVNGFYISQLIRYAKVRSVNNQFLNRGKLLRNKLMVQGFQQSRLKSAFRKLYGRDNDLVRQYNLSLGQMLSDVFHTDCYSVLGTLILTTENFVYLIKI